MHRFPRFSSLHCTAFRPHFLPPTLQFADEEDRSLLDSEEQQRRQQLVAEVDINTAQIEEREQGMRELESQMCVDSLRLSLTILTIVSQKNSNPGRHVPALSQPKLPPPQDRGQRYFQRHCQHCAGAG